MRPAPLPRPPMPALPSPSSVASPSSATASPCASGAAPPSPPPSGPRVVEADEDGVILDGALTAPRPRAPVRRVHPEATTVTASGKRRRLTPEERAERDAHREALGAWKTRQLDALEAISPALAHPDGPPIRDVRPVVQIAPGDLGAEAVDLYREPRLSTSGRPGSALVIRARKYDGSGPSGGFHHEYVAVFAEWRDAHGGTYRTRGATIRADEVRAVIAALTEWADSLPPEAFVKREPSCE